MSLYEVKIKTKQKNNSEFKKEIPGCILLRFLCSSSPKCLYNRSSGFFFKIVNFFVQNHGSINNILIFLRLIDILILVKAGQDDG